MIAVRSVQELIAGAVTVKLSAHFVARRVEVIVLPLEEDRPAPALLEDLLLAAPALSDEELKSFAEVSNGHLANFEREVAAFEALDTQLQEQYAGKAVAIYQGQIVADGDSKLAVLDAVLARFGQVPCYVDWVKPNGPRGVRVPSAWIAQCIEYDYRFDPPAPVAWRRFAIRSALKLLAPRADLATAGQRVPGRLGPFDGGVGAHGVMSTSPEKTAKWHLTKP